MVIIDDPHHDPETNQHNNSHKQILKKMKFEETYPLPHQQKTAKRVSSSHPNFSILGPWQLDAQWAQKASPGPALCNLIQPWKNQWRISTCVNIQKKKHHVLKCYPVA